MAELAVDHLAVPRTPTWPSCARACRTTAASPHWGYVIKGKLTYHYGDRSETIEAGEAYFAPPGHTPELHAGTEVIEFSPSHELERTMEVVTRNVEAMQAQP